MFYPIHGENKDFMFMYLLIVSVLYGIYKFIGFLVIERETNVSALKLILFFLMQLFVVCVCFFVFTTGNTGYGLVLFFKIIFFLLGVSFLWINFYSLGNTLLKQVKFLGIECNKNKILASLGLGFTVFMLGVFILASVGAYNIQSILAIIIVTIIIGYKSWMHIFTSLKKPLKTYSHKLSVKATFVERYNISLIIDELHYIVVTFLISINLVSIYRPFPIGWDDLGSYMNYPKLLGEAGEHLALGKMYLWELYTGIGFLFGSQTFAFYLNSFSGVIAAIVIYSSISSIIKKRETTFDLGLFSVMIILMMPMVVFQLAKDMKLDLGLLSISIIALSLFYQAIFSKEKEKIGIYALIGILIGTAFAIKVTSLLLLLGVIGGMFYKKYSLGGFLAFLGMFIGVFSYLGLWSMMNVVLPGDLQNLQSFAIISFGVGGCIFIWNHIAGKQDYQYLYHFAMQLGALLLGFILILLPWGIKHIGELPQGGALGAGTIVAGYSDAYRVDYKLIHSDAKIEEIRNKNYGISESGTTMNADFGRYFGYEKGVNNYLKLPWNLSFQTNQKGEFTDITYIFFALIPALFLFLPYRREVYKYPVMGALLVSLIYFIPNPVSVYISGLFSTIILPSGYLIMGGLFLIPLTYFHFTLDKTDKISRIFLVNLAFTTIYVGLWAVSAFGIVWYGILMYFLFLIMITLCLLIVESREGSISKYSSYIVICIVWVYVLQSVIPHGITNLRSAGYPDYKLGGMSEEVALMNFHPEYFNILFELNVGDEYKKNMFIEYRNNLLKVLDNNEKTLHIVSQIQNISDIGLLTQYLKKLVRVDFGETMNSDIENLQQSLYEDVIYTRKETKNTKKIYRAGTFLKYYISENKTRLFEDSLLVNFDEYIYDENPEISVERFQKLGIGYILLDINAATIDRDPRRNLTQRYEKILTLATNPHLKLIDTDSVCLKVALDSYKIDKNLGEYMDIAGVNYSYKKSSQQKKAICIQKIVGILGDTQQLESYPYLSGYILSLEKANISLSDPTAIGEALFRGISNGYKVLFKIK